MRLMTKLQKRKRRQNRVRARVNGSEQRPRLSVQRSLRGLYLQLIDDAKGKTMVSVNSKKEKLTGDVGERTGKIASAYLLGKVLANKAKDAKINTVVFDRAGNQFHGRVKAVADGARDGGLQF
jgi:large subunit ribosomal protein L18